MKAVKAGYAFNVFSEDTLMGISLEPTGTKVEVDGTVYPLYRGTDYGESQKIDHLLDLHGDMPIREHKVKEKAQER